MDNTNLIGSENESKKPAAEPETLKHDGEENKAQAEEHSEKKGVGGYRLIAILTFLLTVGGLFIGFLGSLTKVAFLEHNSFLTNDVTTLKGSLLGWCIYTVQTVINAISSAKLSEHITDLVSLVFILLLAAAVLSSLICLILTFAKRDKAKDISYNGAKLSALSYLLLTLWVFCHCALNGGAIAECNDYPLYCIGLAILIILAVSACLHDKPSNGVWHIIGLIVTVAAAVMLCYPSSIGVTTLQNCDFSNLSTLTPKVIVALVLAALILFNIIVAVFNLGNTQCAPFHIVRNALMFIAAVVYIVMLAIDKDNPLASDNNNLIVCIILALCTFCAFTIPLIVFLVKRPRKEKAPKEKKQKPVKEAKKPVEEKKEVVQAPVEDHVTQDLEFIRNLAMIANGFSPEPMPEPQGDPHRYDTNKLYTYDPFINTLTEGEKNEFGDLFIAKKNGSFGDLPKYVIGEENSEFFRKVWIHYSAYDMTPGLKEKLYMYIRSISSK